jgi:hypothetical protein
VAGSYDRSNACLNSIQSGNLYQLREWKVVEKYFALLNINNNNSFLCYLGAVTAATRPITGKVKENKENTLSD